MNKPTFSTTIAVILGLLIFLPLFASAAPSITETSVKLTADYGKFVDEDDDFIVVTTGSFTVVNDGNSAITVKAIGLPAKYTSQSTVTVPANTTSTVTLTIEVPHSKSPGTEKIGTIAITDSNNAQLDSADLMQETVSMLDLTELEVKYVDADGRTQKDEFTAEEGTYKLENEVKPYTEMTLTFDLQNLFDRDYQKQGQLEEIELVVDVDDNDLLQAGFDETHQLENIEAGKEGKFTVTLPISEMVEPDAYTIEFTITAEDGEGIEYEIKRQLDLEVELDDEDIRIVKAQLMPESVTVCDKEVSLQTEVHNFGSDDQTKVRVTLSNAELGLNEKIENIVVEAYTEDDDSWQKTFIIPLADAKEKVYFLDLKTYIENTLTDAQVVQLQITPCATGEQPVVEEEEEEQPVTGDNQAPENPASKDSVTGSIIKSIEKASYTSNDYLIALMLIAIAVAAAMIVLMLVVLFKA